MLIPVKVRNLGLDRRTDTPVVVLEEVDGERILPIWIGPGEASAIAARLSGLDYARPLTHDLLVSVIEAFGGRLESVEMSSVEEGTYRASMHLRRDDDEMIVDARPSDAIAVALRMNAPMFAGEGLLREDTIKRDGVELHDSGDEEE